MSIIEKAAEKLDQIGKAGHASADDSSTRPASEKDTSIIEKAASKLDQVEKKEPYFAGISAEPGLESKLKATDKEEHAAGARPAPSAHRQEQRQGMINLEKLRQQGMITPDGERTQLSEAFRMIKRPLLVNAFNHAGGKNVHRNLIMVTSALDSEGKTFCAANLAMSIAMEMDHTVLLVDADVARPSIPGYLGMETGPGLMDVLLDDKLDLSDVLIRTNVEKLAILPAGNKHKHATELLASHVMSDLLKEIAHRYPDRVVIFDAPPLLLTSEAQVLANQMGQIVMVVEAETTPQKVVTEALRQIESCDAVNLIYNKARPFPGGDFYGYYYN